MSGKERFIVFGFETTHDALRAERALADEGVTALLIPAPKALGTLCGLAARVPEACAGAAEHALIRASVGITARIGVEDRGGA